MTEKEETYKVTFSFENAQLKKASPLHIDVNATSNVEAVAMAEAELDKIVSEYSISGVKKMKGIQVAS